jgi:hypothetical protein
VTTADISADPGPGVRVGAWLLSGNSRSPGVTISGMARVRYEAKENAGHKFWVARSGRYAIRIDANRPGVYPPGWSPWRAARSAKALLPAVTRRPTR